MECSVPTNWPSESARHSGVRTTSICPSPKMSPDRALDNLLLNSVPDASYERGRLHEMLRIGGTVNCLSMFRILFRRANDLASSEKAQPNCRSLLSPLSHLACECI